MSAQTCLDAATFGTARPARRALPIRLWHVLARGRSALGKLDAHLLADIGISPELAKTESARRFWDVPAHWRG